MALESSYREVRWGELSTLGSAAPVVVSDPQTTTRTLHPSASTDSVCKLSCWLTPGGQMVAAAPALPSAQP